MFKTSRKRKAIYLAVLFVLMCLCVFAAQNNKIRAWLVGRACSVNIVAFDSCASAEAKAKAAEAKIAKEKALADASRNELINREGFKNNNVKILSSIDKDGSLNYLYSDIDYIYERNAQYCPSYSNSFLDNLKETHKITCSRIVYKNTEHQTFSLLIEAPASSKAGKLLVYNHGHGGLPRESEPFALTFFNDALTKGYDILLISMPFVGLNAINYNFGFDSWDGPAVASAKTLYNNPSYMHGVFNLVNTGESHYMRYFIDNAVIPVLDLRDKYKSIDYVGLSGGANTGLYACSLLKNILNHCVLVAGVMPINLRTRPKAFGDAEQISPSFFNRNSLFRIIRGISVSKTKLSLIYNDNDPCCFMKESAKMFKQQLISKSINVDFVIRSSDKHDYDSNEIMRIISSP